MALNTDVPLTTMQLPREVLPGLPSSFPDKASARGFFRPFRAGVGSQFDGSKSAESLLCSFRNSSGTLNAEVKFISYEALPGELQLAEFNLRWQERLYFPFYSFSNGVVSEPLFRDCVGEVFRPEEIESCLMLVPAIAVAADGARLGQGGGWYDRAIALLRARNPKLTVVGCVPSPFLIPRGVLPLEEHDQRVDILLTELPGFLRAKV